MKNKNGDYLMFFTVEKSKEFIYVENKKEIHMQGYSFIDSAGRCFCIVYGEGRRDAMVEYLKIPVKQNNPLAQHDRVAS